MNKKLTNPQLKFLKSLAHELKPIIIIGTNGATESLIKELESSLNHHELLKIKIANSDRDARKAIINNLELQTKSILIQSIGKTFVLFKQNKETNINLPK